MLVEEALPDGGFEIIIALSGVKAVKLLDASEGKFRALVTDITSGATQSTAGRLPGMLTVLTVCSFSAAIRYRIRRSASQSRRNTDPSQDLADDHGTVFAG
jgi:hypothetical protein